MYIAKVDATENTKIAESLEIRGFPTLFWFVNGEKQEYTGGRTTDTIVQWVTKKSGPVANELSCDKLDNMVGTGSLSVIYWGAKEGEVYDNFIRSAS
jgi:thioredoxin-like negative regulator of GroEL